ncbi:hypothetical protein M9458_055801, partial [Cirrhinus mrigala]
LTIAACGGTHREPEPAQAVPGGPDRPQHLELWLSPQRARHFYSTPEFILMKCPRTDISLFRAFSFLHSSH